MHRILCIMDESRWGVALLRGFDRPGWSAEVISSRTALGSLPKVDEYAAAVIDLDCGRGDARFDVCRVLRQRNPRIGLVMVSTGGAVVADRVRALDGGADDFLARPFDREELYARVRSLLRRLWWDKRLERSEAVPGGVEGPAGASLKWGPFEVRLMEGITLVDGCECDLTLRQQRMFVRMLRNPGQIVKSEDLWRDLRLGHAPSGLNIRVHVHGLRRRLGPRGKLVVACRGIGYGIGIANVRESSIEVAGGFGGLRGL